MSAAAPLVVAEFDQAEELADALRRLRRAGYDRIDAYTPYPIETVETALPPHHLALPLIVLAGALVGALAGWFVQYLPATTLYPLDVGGRPLNSWPAFMPIAFEIAALCAVAAGFFGFFAVTGLPRLHDPIFEVPGFDRASRDRFFLSVRTADRAQIATLLGPCRPLRLTEVAS
jgi:hypothetical protein